MSIGHPLGVCQRCWTLPCLCAPPAPANVASDQAILAALLRIEGLLIQMLTPRVVIETTEPNADA